MGPDASVLEMGQAKCMPVFQSTSMARACALLNSPLSLSGLFAPRPLKFRTHWIEIWVGPRVVCRAGEEDYYLCRELNRWYRSRSLARSA